MRGVARVSKRLRRVVALALTVAALLALLAPVAAPAALANGGTLRVSNATAGPYTVSVYTSPSPLAPGLVDISFLVQRPGTTEVVDGATVAVTATPLDGPGAPVTGRATRELATNKLFYAAEFVLPEAGRWRIDAAIAGAAGRGELDFEVAVGQPGLPIARLAIGSFLATLALAAAWWALRGRRRPARPPSVGE